MSRCPVLFVVLPAYNEAAALPPLLESLERAAHDLSQHGWTRRYVVVDDGSEDETPSLLLRFQEHLPLEVIRHDPNQGLGPTLRDGLRHASNAAEPGDVVVTMDADNTHPPDLIAPMLRKIGEGCDVVIASRFRPGAHMRGLGPIRLLMSHGARVLYSSTLPIPGVRDYTCGFRAYRAAILQDAFRTYGDSLVMHRGFQCMPDVLLLLARLGAVMGEVPMVLRYDRKGGASNMKVMRTVVQTIGLVIRRRFDHHRRVRVDAG